MEASSPYLNLPLRTLEQALADRAQGLFAKLTPEQKKLALNFPEPADGRYLGPSLAEEIEDLVDLTPAQRFAKEVANGRHARQRSDHGA